MQQKNVIAVVGPTASGKTALAIALARHFDGEILSADSMQIYRGMDIATAKATPQERREAVHHLIDIAGFDENYSVAKFTALAQQTIAQITARGKIPILAGGTGLYVSSILDGIRFVPMENDPAYRKELSELARQDGEGPLREELGRIDPESARRIAANDIKRLIRALEVYHVTGKTLSYFHARSRPETPPYRACILALSCRERQYLYERINRRVEQMFAAGLVDEVRALMDQGFGKKDTTASRAIGYRQVIAYLKGEITLEQAKESIKQETRRYAKRQLSWWRREERAHTLEIDILPEFDALVQKAVEIVAKELCL